MSQAFSQLWVLTDVRKDIVTFFKQAESECSETNLYDSSVVLDLIEDLLIGNIVLNMRLLKKIFGLIESVVD